jgi:hypothetical protein
MGRVAALSDQLATAKEAERLTQVESADTSESLIDCRRHVDLLEARLQRIQVRVTTAWRRGAAQRQRIDDDACRCGVRVCRRTGRTLA